jgi:hypothetical protein
LKTFNFLGSFCQTAFARIGWTGRKARVLGVSIETTRLSPNGFVLPFCRFCQMTAPMGAAAMQRRGGSIVPHSTTFRAGRMRTQRPQDDLLMLGRATQERFR